MNYKYTITFITFTR